MLFHFYLSIGGIPVEHGEIFFLPWGSFLLTVGVFLSVGVRFIQWAFFFQWVFILYCEQFSYMGS
jgi:hypothetical protein